MLLNFYVLSVHANVQNGLHPSNDQVGGAPGKAVLRSTSNLSGHISQRRGTIQCTDFLACYIIHTVVDVMTQAGLVAVQLHSLPWAALGSQSTLKDYTRLFINMTHF